MGFGGEKACQLWQVRHHLAQFAQSEAAQLNADVLQGNGIFTVGLHAETNSVIAIHVYVGIDTHVLVQVDPVSLVCKRKLAVSYDRIFRC